WRRWGWRRRIATGNVPRQGSSHASLQFLQRVLSVLPLRAFQPDVATAALHRQPRGTRAGGDRDPAGQSLVASRGAAVRLWLRLGRALLLRAQPAGDLQASVLFVCRRLGDVRRHPARPRPLLIRREVRPESGLSMFIFGGRSSRPLHLRTGSLFHKAEAVTA